MLQSNDYHVRILEMDINGRIGWSFALFHVSAQGPVMYSPYLFDEKDTIRLGKVFASQFGLHFIDPHAPKPPVKRDFKLIQGGKSGGKDLQELPERETLSGEENDSELGEDPLFC